MRPLIVSGAIARNRRRGRTRGRSTTFSSTRSNLPPRSRPNDAKSRRYRVSARTKTAYHVLGHHEDRQGWFRPAEPAATQDSSAGTRIRVQSPSQSVSLSLFFQYFFFFRSDTPCTSQCTSCKTLGLFFFEEPSELVSTSLLLFLPGLDCIPVSC